MANRRRFLAESRGSLGFRSRWITKRCCYQKRALAMVGLQIAEAPCPCGPRVDAQREIYLRIGHGSTSEKPHKIDSLSRPLFADSHLGQHQSEPTKKQIAPSSVKKCRPERRTHSECWPVVPTCCPPFSTSNGRRWCKTFLGVEADHVFGWHYIPLPIWFSVASAATVTLVSA